MKVKYIDGKKVLFLAEGETLPQKAKKNKQKKQHPKVDKSKIRAYMGRYQKENVDNMTPGEIATKRYLDSINANYIAQHLVICKDKPYLLDFYVTDSKRRRLDIEVDGGYHYTKIQMKKDSARAFDINKSGIKVIRITNEEALSGNFSKINKWLGY